jgi:hypothetical protein
MINSVKKALLVASTTILLTLPQLTLAADDAVVVEKPTALAMTGDAIIARPVLFVMTAVGSVLFLVSLPFSLAGGNAGEAGKVLVLQPAETTFIRCLGCKQPGYKKTVQEVEGSDNK